MAPSFTLLRSEYYHLKSNANDCNAGSSLRTRGHVLFPYKKTDQIVVTLLLLLLLLLTAIGLLPGGSG